MTNPADDQPLEWHRLLGEDELDEGRVTTVAIGTRTLAVSKYEGEFGCIDNACPHQGIHDLGRPGRDGPEKSRHNRSSRQNRKRPGRLAGPFSFSSKHPLNLRCARTGCCETTNRSPGVFGAP